MQQLKRNYYSVREFVSRRGKRFTTANSDCPYLFWQINRKAVFKANPQQVPLGYLSHWREICLFPHPEHITAQILFGFGVSVQAWFTQELPFSPLTPSPSFFWQLFEMLLRIFLRFLRHFPLHSRRGCLGRAAERLWVSKPAGSPFPAMARCPFSLVLKRDSCRAVLTIPITGMSIPLPVLIPAVSGGSAGAGGRGWRDKWHLWARAELLGCCVWSLRAWASSQFASWCLLELQGNVHCWEMGIALPWLCSQDTPSFAGSWKPWQELPGPEGAHGMAAFEASRTALLWNPSCPLWSLLVVFWKHSAFVPFSCTVSPSWLILGCCWVHFLPQK